MSDEIITFEQWCQKSWGTSTRRGQQLFAASTPQIRDAWCFDSSSPPLKVLIAEKLVLESCSHVGSFAESGDVSWYIWNFGRKFQGAGEGFNGRRVQPLKAALLLVACLEFSSALPAARSDFGHIRAGGGALAATYLLAQLEYLFRVNGRYLGKDGTVVREVPQQLKKKAGLRASQKQINQIHQAFVLYLYRNRTALGKRLQKLDSSLGIAKRLRTIRNPAMHGELADPTVEANFLALLVAMFYYSEKVT